MQPAWCPSGGRARFLNVSSTCLAERWPNVFPLLGRSGPGVPLGRGCSLSISFRKSFWEAWGCSQSAPNLFHSAGCECPGLNPKPPASLNGGLRVNEKGDPELQRTYRKSKAKPNGKKPAAEEKKMYLEPEYTKSRITDIGFKELVVLPREIDLNEWLASNTTTFFHHVNLQYSTISEFCTGEACQTMAVCNTDVGRLQLKAQRRCANKTLAADGWSGSVTPTRSRAQSGTVLLV
ncbi:MOB kinase activator 2 isoform X4 [Suricata suricatta]|uniref:MOB kinase activator 2 isoform X4 n=1 Tax=Suricata suricatta TaxID=37032 RepID=UPI001156A73C|nr:MOB kinase activator 2 isoform X4 [Suricata suricatta]